MKCWHNMGTQAQAPGGVLPIHRAQLGWVSTPHTGWCLCDVNIKTETGYGVVLCSTGLPIVTSMIPGDCFGCVSSVQKWGQSPRLNLTIIIGGLQRLQVVFKVYLQSLQLVCWCLLHFPWWHKFHSLLVDLQLWLSWIYTELYFVWTSR